MAKYRGKSNNKLSTYDTRIRSSAKNASEIYSSRNSKNSISWNRNSIIRTFPRYTRSWCMILEPSKYYWKFWRLWWKFWNHFHDSINDIHEDSNIGKLQGCKYMVHNFWWIYSSTFSTSTRYSESRCKLNYSMRSNYYTEYFMDRNSGFYRSDKHSRFSYE